MTMEPGGRAEKLGNDYERLWGAHALLSILDGEATSVLSEPLGEDEPGVDFWVRRPDGTRHCQQCKRENGDTGAVLEGELVHVLRALRSHDINVVAIHHHMIFEEPRIIFLHYWGKGTVAELVRGLRAALDRTSMGREHAGR